MSSIYALASGEIIALACLVNKYCATWCSFIKWKRYNACSRLLGCECMGRVQYIVRCRGMEWSRVVKRGMGAINIRSTQCCRTEAVGYQASLRLDSCLFGPECYRSLRNQVIFGGLW